MKEIYIVQSQHPNPAIRTFHKFLSKQRKGKETEKVREEGERFYEGVIERFRCAYQIAKDLILREEIADLYSDGMTKECAHSLNYRAALIQKKCEPLYNEGVEGKCLEELAFTPSEIEEGSATIIATIAECNFRHIDTKLQATENKVLDNTIARILLLPLMIIEALLYNVMNVYPITARLREKYIHRNIKRNAKQKSILFMGSNHELTDFYKPNSGFAVATVRITNDGLEYKHANRDGIPYFFREIAERRYAEIKTVK